MIEPVSKPKLLSLNLLAVPLLLLIVGVVATSGVGYWLQTGHIEELRAISLSKAEAGRAEIETHLRYRFASLARMAGRWNAAGGIDKDLWERDAEAYYSDQPEFQAVVYLDNDASVRWVIPKAPNERFVGQSLAFEPKRAAAIEQARNTDTAAYSGVVQLANQNDAVLLVFQLYDEEKKPDGFLVGAYDLELLMNSILPNVGLDEFQFILFENKTPIFTLNPSASLLEGLAAQEEIPIEGLNWAVEVAPHSSLAEAKETETLYAIFLGLMGSILLASSIYFIRLNIERTRREAAIALRGQLIIDGSQVGIWEWFDTNETAQYWSPELYKLFGLEPGEIEANYENFQNLIHPDDRAGNNKAIRASLDAENLFRIESRMRLKDGSYEWFEFRGSRWFNKSGSDYFFATCANINDQKTAQQKAQDIQAFQNLIFETIPALLFVKDEQYRIVNANPAFLEVYPAEMRDRVIGSTTFDSYSAEEAEDFLRDDKLAFKDGVREVEETIDFPDGHRRTLATKKVRFANANGERFILAVAHDITALKDYEQALLKSNRDLDDFAYIASHDLKEPLRGIHNYARFLTEDYAEKLDDDGRHQLSRIMHLSQRMEKLISDLLQYSRLGRDTERKKPVDVNAVIEEIDDMLPDQDDYQLVVPERLPTLVCDEILIKEVFRNLITNGLRYNDSEQKSVEIGFKSPHPRGPSGHAVFYVRDNGIGIEPGFFDDIFKMFKRLHHRDSYGGGSGAGLAFVKKIVNQLGGEIWLESTPGTGSTFYFTLPQG